MIARTPDTIQTSLHVLLSALTQNQSEVFVPWTESSSRRTDHALNKTKLQNKMSWCLHSSSLPSSGRVHRIYQGCQDSMEWKVLGFKLTSVKKTKQKHFRLICDTERTEQSVAVISSCCLRDTEILFPQHVAAANKSSMTRVSLDLSPLFVPSI